MSCDRRFGGHRGRVWTTAERRHKQRQHERRNCAYIGCLWADARAMSIRSTVPAILWWLFWLLVALLLIILAALVIHHFGGFDLSFHVGDFHFDLGVTGQH
jgi:hypothetical protein